MAKRFRAFKAPQKFSNRRLNSAKLTVIFIILFLSLVIVRPAFSEGQQTRGQNQKFK